MKNIKIKFLLVIILLVISGVLVFFMYQAHHIGSNMFNDLKGYSATISKLKIQEDENSVSVKIYVDEYDCELILQKLIIDNISLDDLRKINEGDMITFITVGNIENKKYDYLLSLETENGVIFSIDDYNNYISGGRNHFVFLLIIVTVVDVLLIIYILRKK